MIEVLTYKVHMPGQTATYLPVDAYLHRDFFMFPLVGDMGGDATELYVSDRVSISAAESIVREVVGNAEEAVDEFNTDILKRFGVREDDVWVDRTRPRRVGAYHRSMAFARRIFDRVIQAEYGYPAEEPVAYCDAPDQPTGDVFLMMFYKEDASFAAPLDKRVGTTK